MADKELRKMNRTELIEIIYALQQTEQTLAMDNESLKNKLDDKMLRIENSGSIAEAALSLNHIFEDAQSAAEEYLLSVKDAEGHKAQIIDEANKEAEDILAEAKKKAEEVLSEAREKADEIITEAEQQEKEITLRAEQREKETAEACEAANKLLAQAKEEEEKAVSMKKQAEEACDQAQKQKQAVDKYKDSFLRGAVALVKQHPELAAVLKPNENSSI